MGAGAATGNGIHPSVNRADSSKSVVHDDGRRKGPGPEALEAGVFALRSLEDGSAESLVRAFLASDQIRADKPVRAPVLSFVESALISESYASPHFGFELACRGTSGCQPAPDTAACRQLVDRGHRSRSGSAHDSEPATGGFRHLAGSRWHLAALFVYPRDQR